jgi:membrane complex biogenesis BtpA family protein
VTTPSFASLLSQGGIVIGMVHVGALPGTPRVQLDVGELIRAARSDALALREGGVHAIAIENMHDVPYLKGTVGPEIVSAMSVIAAEVRRSTDLPCGVQILAGANREALAVAHAAGLAFIRAEGFAFAHVADEGLIESSAGDLLRYRRAIGASGIAVLADVKKKHSSHAITADVGIAEAARANEFFLADGVIVTGSATGVAAGLDDVRAVKRAVSLPVLVGSGVAAANVASYLGVADAVIVGSDFKHQGHWSQPVDVSRVRALMEAARVRG